VRSVNVVIGATDFGYKEYIKVETAIEFVARRQILPAYRF